MTTRKSQTTDMPRISCLMVSRGHGFPARFAVQCYQGQTYANRELIIVTNRKGGGLQRWIETLGDPSIRFIQSGEAVLGVLRNQSVAAATGDYVCVWDDDDLYHPRRLERQYAALRRANAVAHFSSQLTFWWPARRLVGLTHERPWEGSMLARRDIMPPYPEIPLKEDTELVDKLRAQHPISLSRIPGTYCYVVHGRNSWAESHFERNERQLLRRATGNDYEEVLQRLSANLPVVPYAQYLASKAAPIAASGRAGRRPRARGETIGVPALSSNTPKISCLMVSRGHLFPGRLAVECYRRQTYANRELVIVTSRKDGNLVRWVRELNDPSITVIETGDAILGALRNISVSAATGELVCIWDDDDLYHPRRLEIQQAELAKSGAAAHFSSQLLLWWPARQRLAVSNEREWEGSMLAHRELLPAYPDLPLKEDKSVVVALREKHPIAVSRIPRSYCYVIHGRNSWHAGHFEEMFRHATQEVTKDAYTRELAKIAEIMPVDAYARGLAIRAKRRQASASPAA